MKIVSGTVNKKLRVRHNNFDEYLKYVSNTPRLNGNGNDSTSYTARDSWDLGAGWDGAMELSRRGWPEGLKAMNKARRLVDIPEHSDQGMQMKPFNAVAGDEVDVGLHLSGEPECMIDYHLQLTPSYGKVAKIIVNASASGSVNAKVMRYRGTAACILIDCLESAGVRCEVILLAFCSGELTSEVLIKKPDEHVEPDRMAFMLAHPAVMRRFGFKEAETHGGEIGKTTKTGTYGYPRDLPVSETEEEGTIYFDRYYSGYETESGMVRKTNELLSKYVETDLAVAA